MCFGRHNALYRPSFGGSVKEKEGTAAGERPWCRSRQSDFNSFLFNNFLSATLGGGPREGRHSRDNARSRACSPSMHFGPYLARCRTARLGSGHYGTVLAGVHARTGTRVAIKIEADSTEAERSSAPRGRLAREAAVYHDMDATPGFPRLHWFGRAHGYVAIVLDRLGASLRDVHQAAGGSGSAGLQLNAQAVQHVGREALLRLETLHDAGWLHMDVKPANLLLPPPRSGHVEMALDAEPLLHLVDYGLSRRWGGEARAERSPRRRRGVVGTGRFASLANHEAEAPLGRRDDLEATLLSLVYLRRGRLPWSGISAPTKRERFAQMLESKRAATVGELSNGMFDGFESAFTRVRALDAGERPPYDELRRLLSVVA